MERSAIALFTTLLLLNEAIEEVKGLPMLWLLFLIRVSVNSNDTQHPPLRSTDHTDLQLTQLSSLSLVMSQHSLPLALSSCPFIRHLLTQAHLLSLASLSN